MMDLALKIFSIFALGYSVVHAFIAIDQHSYNREWQYSAWLSVLLLLFCILGQIQ